MNENVCIVPKKASTQNLACSPHVLLQDVSETIHILRETCYVRVSISTRRSCHIDLKAIKEEEGLKRGEQEVVSRFKGANH